MPKIIEEAGSHRARYHGGVTQAAAFSAAHPATALPALASAFGVTSWLAAGLTARALLPALLPGRDGIRTPLHHPAADRPHELYPRQGGAPGGMT